MNSRWKVCRRTLTRWKTEYYKAGEKSNINREIINGRNPKNHEKNFYKNYMKKFIRFFEVKI